MTLRFSVGMHEALWKRVDRPGEPANREHMLMALAGLEYIIVKVRSPDEGFVKLSQLIEECDRRPTLREPVRQALQTSVLTPG